MTPNPRIRALDTTLEPPPTTQDHLQVTHRKGNIFKQKGTEALTAFEWLKHSSGPKPSPLLSN
ncbi:hypothetical protein MTR_3g013805 [Medicago truncatula]|uniref:Uncharacterized protein n=1 Tax=Medicago truncatula TaxID=3880 RepID=A0A072TTG2_MEDTR|nr:hypothetical protein MTR_8g069253 [Medicago truncatula]KEH33001.1 hypothetical protein MTR_3g013805 [Medicago truncatula]